MFQSRKPIIGAVGSILIVAATMLSACAPDVAHAANVAAAALAQSAGENAEGAALTVAGAVAMLAANLPFSRG